jgi:ATP/ADP translocase
MIFGVIFATQVVSTVLDLRFSGLVEEALAVQDERTAYLGRFYARLNSVAFFLQFVITPICLRFLPLWLIHGCIPLVHVATSVALLVRPSLATGSLAYLLFKAFDYSAFRAGKELFYIPLSFDARYRAKEIIDAFGYRFAKGVSSGAVGLARIAFQTIPAMVYPIIAIGFAGLWMLMILPVTREHARMERERRKESPSL